MKILLTNGKIISIPEAVDSRPNKDSEVVALLDGYSNVIGRLPLSGIAGLFTDETTLRILRD